MRSKFIRFIYKHRGSVGIVVGGFIGVSANITSVFQWVEGKFFSDPIAILTARGYEISVSGLGRALDIGDMASAKKFCAIDSETVPFSYKAQYLFGGFDERPRPIEHLDFLADCATYNIELTCSKARIDLIGERYFSEQAFADYCGEERLVSLRSTARTYIAKNIASRCQHNLSIERLRRAAQRTHDSWIASENQCDGWSSNGVGYWDNCYHFPDTLDVADVQQYCSVIEGYLSNP